MELLETDSTARLLAGNDEYRRLARKHRQYEKRLEQIADRRPFTQQDWFEQNVLKKRKLYVRDRMEDLARRTLAQEPAVATRA